MLDDLQLTTVLRDGVLFVTTKDEAQQRFETVVYDVAELVMDGPINCCAEPGSITRCLCDDIKQAALIELIKKSTSAYWEPERAPWPVIEPLETGLLVIHQTQAVHDEIAALLTPLIDKAIAERARTGLDKPGPPKLMLRSYLLSKETAADLVTNIKQLVVVPSWTQPVEAELPAVYVLAAEPRLQEVDGKVVGGPFEVREDAPEPKPQPNKPVGFAPTERTKNYIVRPQSHLMIRQTPQNHREIERFLRDLTGNDWLRGTTPGIR